MDTITTETQGVKRPIETFYKGCWVIGLGLEYRITDAFVFRGGVKYDEGATERKGLNPDTVDVDLVTPSINLAYDITQCIEMNITALVTFGLKEEFNGKEYNKNFLCFMFGFRLNY